jgi:GT2 family glycosyltransferase
MNDSRPTISVVVPTYRRPDALEATLSALEAVGYQRGLLQIIVVDDGSGDRTPDVVASHEGVKCVQQKNGGAASARNHGARVAGGELLIFIDDDIIVAPGHLDRHLAVHDRHPRALVNGEWEFAAHTVRLLEATPFGRYRLELEEHFREGSLGQPLADGCRQLDVIPSQDLSLARSLFWEIGGFDERFPAAGAEDQEFSYRARDAGCLLLRDPSIRLLHNDARVTLEDFCRREERSAGTIPHLARRYPQAPAALSYAHSNGPVARHDGIRLAGMKLAKQLLAHEPVLRALRAGVTAVERLRAPDPVLARAYAALAGLYVFRGYRRAVDQV